jgi:hypothetical protein
MESVQGARDVEGQGCSCSRGQVLPVACFIGKNANRAKDLINVCRWRINQPPVEVETMKQRQSDHPSVLNT